MSVQEYNIKDLTDNGRPPKLGKPKIGKRLRFNGGSGFTPVDDTFPRFPSAAAGITAGITVQDKDRIRYQRRELYGFTTLEFQNLDVITTRPLKPGNLPDKLFDLFRRDDVINCWEEEIPSDFVRDKPCPLPTPLKGDCKHPVTIRLNVDFRALTCQGWQKMILSGMRLSLRSVLQLAL